MGYACLLPLHQSYQCGEAKLVSQSVLRCMYIAKRNSLASFLGQVQRILLVLTDVHGGWGMFKPLLF